MKSGYLILLIVAIYNAQDSLTFCYNYFEYDITHQGRFISHVNCPTLQISFWLIIDQQQQMMNLMYLITNYTCEQIFKQSSGLFFVGCQKSEKSPYLVAYRSINNTHFSQFGDIYFRNFKYTISVTPTEVRLLTLVVKQTNWDIQTTQNVFDQDSFRALGIDIFVDISFSPFSSDNLQYYKLIIVDRKGGAYWVDTIVKNNILQPGRSGRIYVAFIHSTTQNQSVISFINSDDFQGHPFVQENYDQNLTSVKFLFHYQTSKVQASGSLIYSRNQEGMMFRDKLKKQRIMDLQCCYQSRLRNWNIITY